MARGWPKPLVDAVCVAWAAQLVTAPLSAGISGRLSLVSAGANLPVAAVLICLLAWSLSDLLTGRVGVGAA